VCTHLICEIIGGACSLAVHRSRGCRANVTAKDVAPERLAEIRQLLAVIDPEDRSDDTRAAAMRLAAIVRREALDDRNVLRIVASDEPDLAPALLHLCQRRA
jgi:hypothetical protein